MAEKDKDNRDPGTITVARLTVVAAVLTVVGAAIGVGGGWAAASRNDPADAGGLHEQVAQLKDENKALRDRANGVEPKSTITITEPRTDAVVPICIPVRGTGAIPPDQDLWVIVNPDDADPEQNHWASLLVDGNNPDGTWSADLISVGSDETAGERYTILAVLVDEAFVGYLKSAGVDLRNLEGNPSVPELVTNGLPPHDEEAASVRVTRSDDTRCG